MALTNQERVGKGLELLRAGLAPYVEREVQDAFRRGALAPETMRRFLDDPLLAKKPIAEWDVSNLLKLMADVWSEVFRQTLGVAERSLVVELRNWRNKWAHQQPFSSDDADRALDSMARLLTAISAAEADEVNRMKLELRRLVFAEQVRSEKRKAGGSLVEAAAQGALKPWREVATPHADVASGRYQQAEFAADLWQVHLGEGSDEYRDPQEFFRRTFLTRSLRRLLVNAVQRLSGAGGDPVVQLQTNFGGGKTHAMLALYHLFSGVSPAHLPGVDALLAETGVTTLPRVRRVALVGNKISPGNPVRKPDGTVVRTLWGELAYQLGGREAYARIAADDERATSPGDALRTLFNDYGPCLILIDEWVAYARQLHDSGDLPGGNFETQFSFAQALTESAKLARNCLLVISLPASDSAKALDDAAEYVEVGGVRGREALERLRNVIGRLESAWRPATAEESFEIVRRRLFEPLAGPDAYRQRDVTARAFAELYQANRDAFPAECATGEYEQRIQAAYPIHPEVFDALYGGWSTLVKFQRTRGVLRLMAAVIHCLWERGDRNPLIMPATIPIDDPRVQFELTRYLSENWAPIIERDIDGPQALPLKIDAEHAHLGRLSATRRVARVIFLGSAPTAAAHRGIDERRIALGSVMPGESPGVFGDAVRRLVGQATYLYQDGTRFWFATQPTVARLAEDRAEQLKRDPDRVFMELERRLRDHLRKPGDFNRVHALPRTSADVPDERETRLVALPPDYPYSKKEEGNPAETAARDILERRGSMPRRYRNALVFLAADRVRLQDLAEATRRFLAWSSILDDKDALDLTPHHVRQAEMQRQAADHTVNVQIPETFHWLLVPEQKTPSAPMTWNAIRIAGADAITTLASRRLKHEDLLIAALGPAVLRDVMDRIPLWRGNHVAVRQLIDDFAQYLYLPRLTSPDVLLRAMRDGVAMLTWRTDGFAYAEGFDETSGRYRGLRGGEVVDIREDDPGVLVKPDVAWRQMTMDRARVEALSAAAEPLSSSAHGTDLPRSAGSEAASMAMAGDREAATIFRPEPARSRPPVILRRFHGAAPLDPLRVGRDASRIAEEVVAHLLGQGAEVKVTLEIHARLPEGAPEQVVRIVSENCRTLRFEEYGFEEDAP